MQRRRVSAAGAGLDKRRDKEQVKEQSQAVGLYECACLSGKNVARTRKTGEKAGEECRCGGGEEEESEGDEGGRGLTLERPRR